ncbi:MAG: hypothetical protein QOI06_1272 [Nocardioidaceae bacterium]|nr:hypothetical protein [Nocardioidaceae bacterium]
MAGTTPPPGMPGPPRGSADPGYWPVGSQPPYRPRRVSHRGLKILALSVVLTVMLGGGAFAFYEANPFQIFRAGPQAAEALPGNAVLYAGIDLNPTAAQKIDALRFLGHFPAFRDTSGITNPNTDIREILVEKALGSAHCSGLSYTHDVQPWLGERFGLAVMPHVAHQTEPFAYALQVGDENAARQGVHALEACQGTGSGGSAGLAGMAFANGYLLLAHTQAQADAYAKSAANHSLADNAEFKADTGSLGDPGVITTWVDVGGAVAAIAGASVPAAELHAVTSATTRIAATFRFASDHVEVATSIYGDTQPLAIGDNPIVNLPSSTVFALSESGGDQRIADIWKHSLAKARSQSPGIDQQISLFEAQTGFRLPGDIETLFGQNILLALDNKGLNATALGSGDPSQLNYGIRITNDPAKLDALYNRLVHAINVNFGADLPLSKRDFPNGIAVATNGAYANKLGALDGNLGETDAFKSVVNDGADQEFVLFFNFDAVKAQIIQSMSRGGAPQQAIDNVQPLKAFGVAAHVDGHYQHVTLRLSVDS